MKYKLIKLTQLSGNKASIYSILFDEINQTSFDIFINENKNEFKSELKDITSRLVSIGKSVGAREHFFTTGEGIPGDGVCALCDTPSKKLRLYCIRYGSLIIIIGGGGPKKVRKFQEDKKLKEENFFLRKLSAEITFRIRNDEIWYSVNNMEFGGNLTFNDQDDE
jgi:hypothetical protein